MPAKTPLVKDTPMRRLSLSLLTCAILTLFALSPPLPVRGDDYPLSTPTAFQTNVTVTRVDIDRDRVEAVDDSGRAYTLDTYQAAIALRGTDRPGHTGDLVPGMRLHVQGTLASAQIVEAARIQVLPFRASRVSPAAPLGPREAGPVTLRGTVESADSRNHLIVVRVRDHERTVYINRQTDLQDVNSDNFGHLAYLPGERVTVVGAFQPNGTILASVISRRLQPGPRTVSAPAPDRSTLIGPVTKQSSRYGSRDIKVRVSVDREILVHVPHDAHIFRADRPISVHDLAKADVVRVRGTPDGDDFSASRIDVLRSNDEGL